ARLVLAFVKAAVANGASVCNYIEAQGYLWRGRNVVGVRARDTLSGDSLEIRARLTLNAAGPWADFVNRDETRFGPFTPAPCSRALCSHDAYSVVARVPPARIALANAGLSGAKDAVVSRSNRHLSAVPWRHQTLPGVWHRHWMASPDAAHIASEELESWIKELNTVHPALKLRSEERRVGKECRSRWSADQQTKTEMKEKRELDSETRRLGGAL